MTRRQAAASSETPASRATPLNIRRGEAADAENLVTVYLDNARHHVSIDPDVHRVPDQVEALERIRTKLADEDAALFVAEDANGVSGMVEIQIAKPPPAGSPLRVLPTARIGIAVGESSRGQGVGTALMLFAERWAIERGCVRMILDVSSANARALRFYERLGYRTYGLLLGKPLAGDSIAASHA